MLRMVRVFRDSDEVIITKPGGAEKMGLGVDDGSKGEDWSAGLNEEEMEGEGGEVDMEA